MLNIRGMSTADSLLGVMVHPATLLLHCETYPHCTVTLSKLTPLAPQILSAITSNFCFIVASISRCGRLRSASAAQYGHPSWVNIRMTRLSCFRRSEEHTSELQVTTRSRM